MNKLPENSDQTKNFKKSPSITRIATRRIINIFVPLMETRLITNSVHKEITALGDYPENTTTIAPLTPYDKWDGEKWVTDTEAQHGAAVDAAEAQRQSLIDAAMASISLIQLKLQAGRKLTQAETTRLNAVLDYIDAVTATDTSTAPDVIWPELPEA